MYLPPPGRPVSSPPSFETPASSATASKRRPSLTAEQIEAIRRDYLAGASWPDMKAKHNAAVGSIARIISDLPKRQPRTTKAKAKIKPVREPGESTIDYAIRVQKWMRDHVPGYAEQFDANRVRGLKAKAKKGLRLAEAECRKLNETETRGRWVTMRSYMRETGLKRGNAGRFIYANAIERRRCYNKVVVYLLPKEQPAVPVPVNPPVPVIIPPPPTFWQRWFGWVRW